jgi:hypothetical protein
VAPGPGAFACQYQAQQVEVPSNEIRELDGANQAGGHPGRPWLDRHSDPSGHLAGTTGLSYA